MHRIGLAHVSIVIALMSLGAALYQGWINSRNLEAVQRDIGRREHLRACKEIIEAYFEVKLRIARLAMPTMGAGLGDPEFEARAAVARFAALGTYLANFQDEGRRVRYTALSRELERLVDQARAAPIADRDALFRAADEIFAGMNADCVGSTRVSLVVSGASG